MSELEAYCERRKAAECRAMCEAADGARAACLVWEVGTVQPAPPNTSRIISPPTRVPPENGLLASESPRCFRAGERDWVAFPSATSATVHSLHFHDSFSENKSDISKILTKQNCDLWVFFIVQCEAHKTKISFTYSQDFCYFFFSLVQT